jgi:hypothetical protein
MATTRLQALTSGRNVICEEKDRDRYGRVVAICRASGEDRAIKTVMRWTGASERTVKGWLSGRSGPSGEHLIALLQNSDTLLERVLRLAGRGSPIESRRLEALKNAMAEAVATIEALLEEG